MRPSQVMGHPLCSCAASGPSWKSSGGQQASCAAAHLEIITQQGGRRCLRHAAARLQASGGVQQGRHHPLRNCSKCKRSAWCFGPHTHYCPRQCPATCLRLRQLQRQVHALSATIIPNQSCRSISDTPPSPTHLRLRQLQREVHVLLNHPAGVPARAALQLVLHLWSRQGETARPRAGEIQY